MNLSLSNSKFDSFKVHERKTFSYDKHTEISTALVFTLFLDLTERKTSSWKSIDTQIHNFRITYCRPTFKLFFASSPNRKWFPSHRSLICLNPLIIRKHLISSLLNENLFSLYFYYCVLYCTKYTLRQPFAFHWIRGVARFDVSCRRFVVRMTACSGFYVRWIVNIWWRRNM